MFAQADELRARGQQGPGQGQMVSGWYVKPSMSQQLAPLVSQIMGINKGRKAEEAQSALTGQMQSDYGDWMRQRPQARTTTTSEEIPGSVAPGPMPEGQEDQAPMRTQLVKSTSTPTREDQMAWASKGLTNPLSKTLAQKYLEDQMIGEPDREAARAFKAQESSYQRQSRLDQIRQTYNNRLAELQVKLADHRLDENQKATLFREADATKRSIAAVEAQSRVDAAHERALAAGQKSSPVPATVVSKMADAEQIAQNLSGSFTSFKPDFGGPGGMVDSFVGKVSPWSSDQQKEAAKWWNTYENTVALIERHTKFGSAFTASEKKSWDAATFSKYDNPQIIAKNLQARAEVAAHYFNRLRNGYVTTGHPSVGEAFPEAPEQFEAIPGGGAQPTLPTTPTMRPSGQSRRKTDLPPGVTLGAALPE